jgi:hypothetical protein
MKITEIICGKSIQVVQMGMPEQWIKLSAKCELGENENPQTATETLFAFIDEQLKRHIPEQQNYPTEIQRLTAKKETIEDLKKEFNVTTK